MLKCDYQLESLLKAISIYSDIVSEMRISEADVKRLVDYINTQNKKMEELNKLINYQVNEIVNLTEEINNLDL